jgi:hypothetical protein
MAEYIAFDPNVEVNGRTILATVAGVGEFTLDFFKAQGIAEIDPQGWYPQQAWLDVLKQLNEEGIAMTLAGMSIPKNADFPPGIDGLPDALAAIDVAYQMNHRNGDIGEYKFERLSANHIRLTCRNPYPSDFDYGIIYQMALEFEAPHVDAVVERDGAPSRLKGDDACVFNVRW